MTASWTRRETRLPALETDGGLSGVIKRTQSTLPPRRRGGRPEIAGKAALANATPQLLSPTFPLDYHLAMYRTRVLDAVEAHSSRHANIRPGSFADQTRSSFDDSWA